MADFEIKSANDLPLKLGSTKDTSLRALQIFSKTSKA